MRAKPLEALIGEVYSAAHAPETWPDALNEIAHAYGAAGAILWDYSLRRARASRGSHLDSREEEATYWDTWCDRDPHVGSFPVSLKCLPSWVKLTSLGHARGTDLLMTCPFRSEQAVPLERLRRTEIYQLMRPRDHVHQIAVGYLAPRSPQTPQLLSLFRGERQGRFPDRDLASLSRLSRHVLWALELEQRGFDSSWQRNRQPEGAGVLIVDRMARILFHDEQAERICRTADGISIRAGRIGARRGDDHRRLRQLIASWSDTTLGQGTASGAHLLISRISGRRHSLKPRRSRKSASYCASPSIR